MALPSQPNYQQGLDILSKLSGVKLVDNSQDIAKLNMMMANAATLQERAMMADIARQTGENIDPYNIQTDKQAPPVQPVVPQGLGKTMTYEQQQSLTRQHNLMVEQQRQEAMARRRALLEQSAKASKGQMIPAGYNQEVPMRSAIDIIKAPAWGE